MADNVTVPRYVRIQHALTGKPLDEMTKAELEAVAEDARLEVGGTGSDGAVTADDLRAAISNRVGAVITRRAPRLPLAGIDFASDEAAEEAAMLSPAEVDSLKGLTPSGLSGGYTVADVDAARNHEEE